MITEKLKVQSFTLSYYNYHNIQIFSNMYNTDVQYNRAKINDICDIETNFTILHLFTALFIFD